MEPKPPSPASLTRRGIRVSVRTPPDETSAARVPEAAERDALVEKVARAIYNSRIPKGGKNYCAFDDLCSHDYHEDYDRVMSDARAAVEATAAPDLYSALDWMVELCHHANPGAFSNGVTDQTGSIDEGDVIASRIIGEARAALNAAGGQQ
jgi:hypothetical protein